MRRTEGFPSAASPYWISALPDVRQMFKALAKSAERIVVSVEGVGDFVTLVLEVVDGFVLLDAAKDDKMNAALLSGAGAAARAELGGVEVHFELGGAQERPMAGGPALGFALPPKIHKLQRREYFRIDTPIAKPMECWIGLGCGRGEYARVVDLSLGGICLRAPAEGFFTPGARHLDCSLDIPGVGSLRFALDVRHVQPANAPGPGPLAGCAFSGLSASAEQALQKFMSRAERERRALVG